MSQPIAPLAVVFDMDGLMFDTEALYQQAYVDAARLAGLDVPIDAIRLTVGMPWVRGQGLLLERLGGDFPVDGYYQRMTARFEELAATGLRMKPGLPELLDLLDRLGLPRAIATSSAHATVQSHLAAHNLAHRFDHVVAHGDYENSKPAPDPFLLAAERLGVPASRCLALEDSPGGVNSAASAGMMTIMVPDLAPPTDELRALCHIVADSLHDVAALLSRSASSAA